MSPQENHVRKIEAARADNQEFKIWSTRVVPYKGPENSEPGKIISLDDIDSPLVACGENAIELISVEPELALKEGEYL